jgi:hypothetical protein
MKVNMKTLKSFETSETTYQTTHRNIPEDLNLQQYLPENLKSREISKTFNLPLFVRGKTSSVPRVYAADSAR